MNSEIMNKLERKLRRLTIKNLMNIIVGGMALVFLVALVVFAAKKIDLFTLIAFDRSLIFSGQVWRVLSFVFEPYGSSPIFIFFSLYFYWLMGTSLEREWGSFRFDLFYLCGVICAIISGLITGYTTNHFLNMSLFFAFALLYPDFEVRLFFVLPLKIKWLAIVDALYFVYMFITSGWVLRSAILFSLVNLALFFGGDLIEKIKRAKRRAEWKRNFR